MKNQISRAMLDSDNWIVEFNYRDSKGVQTRRAVSPIRFLPNGRFLGLCLAREECRQFYLERCTELTLKPASECLMPMPI